jgi:sugar diacid utilization regulator
MREFVGDGPSSGQALTVGQSPRTLLRYLDRSALDELCAAFVDAVGLPAAVLSPDGEIVAGALARCPACAPDTLIQTPQFLTRAGAPATGWVRCEHGASSVVAPISSRIGECLALAAVGSLVLSGADRETLRAALIARGEPEECLSARLATVEGDAAVRAEPAARLLAQTFDAIIHEAAIASANAGLVATQRHVNRELTVLYAVTRALGSGLELNAILQQLVEAVAEMVDSDVAMVGLVEGGNLVTVASRGFLTLEAQHGRLRIGEGLAGRVAAIGESMTCRDMQEDPREYHTVINSREQLHAFAGVPLKLHGETAGVLALYRRTPYESPESELQLLAHIADQAAVAMERARLYEQTRLASGELRLLHGQVASQHEALERATAVHDRLTQMVLEDAGLDAIAASLARLFAAPVAVEDRFHHLLACSVYPPSLPSGAASGETAWTSPEALQDPSVTQLFASMQTSRRPVAFPALPHLGMMHPRVVAPVIAGGELLGFLSVSEREASLEEIDMLALGHATTVVALEMMKQRTRAEVERRLRGELLEELIAGEVHDPAALRRHAAYLGYNLTAPHALLLIMPTEPGDTTVRKAPRSVRASLAEVVQDLAATQCDGAMLTSRVDGIVLAMPLSDCTAAKARDAAETLKRDAARRGATSFTIGLGRICRSPDDFSAACEEARRAIDLARSLGKTNQVVSFEDLGVYRLLVDLPRPTDAVRYAEELLAPLDEYDRRHGTNLISTLEAFLAANGVLQRASLNMAVHVNTLSYRLQRIRDLTGIDLSDSEARLEVHLAVQIRRVVQHSLG